MVRKSLTLLVMALMAIFSVGCCGKESIKYDVTVSLDKEMRDSLSNRKIEVHLVGINEKQNERWQSYSMTKYWQPGDTLAGSVPHKTMLFDPTNAEPQTLSANDPLWDEWMKSGANRLYVLALLPGMISDEVADKDPRRQIEPLACYRWLKRDKKIEVKIQRSGITTVSELRPEH